MTSETSTMCKMLGEITGTPFTVEAPQENRLLLGNRALWFVWCPDIAYSLETGPLKAAWKDKNENLWLETSKIADMIALVEHHYGEKGVHVMPDVKPGATPTGEIPEEVMGYPRVVKLLRSYQDIGERLSKKHGVELKMLYDGGVGVTTVRIGAKIGSPSDDLTILRKQIIDAAKVLSEAYDAVLDARLEPVSNWEFCRPAASC